MWTNVFRIGGLHQISWFQFLPHESDLKSLPDRSLKVDQKDAAALVVLSSHQQLQKEGFLSAWTNSFVGPWDPSQGIHNPDEKLKLWLFLPGRHSTVVEKAQAAISRLRVLASGLWLAPGDSEEVAAALSQALRNCIERALAGLSYLRFGDVFSRYHPFSQSEELFRRGQLVVEFVFAASEEAVFVHVVVSAKHIRTITSGDMETILERSSSFSRDGLPVIVSPHGMLGKLTGCCPGDLVQEVYVRSGNLRASNGLIGLPNPVSQGSSCKLRGQSCYLEVTLGCSSAKNDKTLQANLNKNISAQHISESSSVTRDAQKGSERHLPVCEKTFIYPAEAVLVPVVQTSFARSSLKRFWLQNWMGPLLSGSSFLACHDNVENLDGSWLGSSGIHSRRGYRSSSNSNSSSISSISTSSDSDYKMNTGAGDLDADADSLTCGQSGLSSADQLNNDGRRLGNKRTRPGMTESFSQAGAVSNAGMQVGSIEVNASVSSGVAKEHQGWDWEDDDRGVGMDIQALLSEFGDFGDFFENDILPFGEPPGTTDSQDLMLPTPDGDMASNSPYTGMLDVPEQITPVEFSSFESFNPPPVVIEESLSKTQLVSKDGQSSDQMDYTPASSTGEFDNLIKAEALMTFAPEYGAVETLTGKISSSFFGNPYIPKSRKADSVTSTSNNYVYSATPPPPFLGGSEEKAGMSLNVKGGSGRHDAIIPSNPEKYYTHVESAKAQHDRRLLDCSSSISSREKVPVSSFSDFKSTNTSVPVENKIAESTTASDSYLLSTKTVLADEVECIMFQAYMCKMRHTLLSSSSFQSAGFNRLSGRSVLNNSQNDPSIMLDNMYGKYDVKKKESIPVRIAGDIDGGMLDGPLNAAVGVWRSVGVSKGSKPTTPRMELSAPLPHNSYNEESLLSYAQKQPLQELLNVMPLLVQQATSFVDVALDADCNDGPYGWLALQEQWRRGFSCGPSMVHAGCGGVLASSHSRDIAGVELVDTLAANVQASSVISLIQSDIKAALKSAFGTFDGPLLVTDWCSGRSQSGDAGALGDGFSAESSASVSECRDSASNITLSAVEPISPLQSAGGSSLKDGSKVDETSERRSNQDTSISESEQQLGSRLGPTLLVLPFPSILVGYQDDWLRTSANSLQVWEKAPLEPYAMQKHMAYAVVCPDIDPLTTAAADFFQQLGTVYETCKLGTHSPQSLGNHMEVDSRKLSSTGFVLLDCPKSTKIESSTASLVGSISDYFLSLSNGWGLTSYLKSLSDALKTLNYGSCLTTNAKEGISGPCMVIYVVCPFPEPIAVLKTVIEASAAVGSVVLSSDKERRNVIQNHVDKALSCLTAVDEASISNVVTLSGFSIPKLVMQIVTVDAIFRITTPSLNELVILKEIAFTVYNKARRVSRGSSTDAITSSTTTMSGRSNSTLMQVTSVPGMWKDCVGSRMTGPSSQREAELDANMRTGNWDSSWQMSRSGGLGFDSNRIGDLLLQDEVHYLFEPLFILAEPGSPEQGVPSSFFGNMAYESSKLLTDDCTSGDTGPSSQFDGPAAESYISGRQKPLPSLHCCYGWTEDWRWLVCIWTDSRGELLDNYIFPFGGISSRQDTKGLQLLFVQILQQGCQILQACSPDTGIARPRDFVITRIGCFFELECQEWQKALYSIGGSEVRKWPIQLRRSTPDGMPPNSNGNTLQQQELSMIQDRTMPSSPSPLYSSNSKTSSYMKGSIAQPSARKQLMGGHTAVDNSRGLLQWVQSISFVSASVNHSLQLVLQADSVSSGATQGSSVMGQSGYLEGFTPVKSLGSTSASYILIPSPSMRFLPPAPLQLPTCLTSESPPLAHLLHSKGSAIPLSTGFVVSKAVPSMRKDTFSSTKEEWPSILSVSLVDYYGGNITSQEKLIKGVAKAGGRGLSQESREFERETHLILETVAAELHALSWMTVSPAYLERRTALPFHCDMILRLQRLLHFADKELTRLPEKLEG